MAEFAAPMSEDIRVLLEKQAITELVYAYSRAVDRRDFALLAQLYAEDGQDDHGALYSGSAAGFIDWLRDVLRDVDMTSHQVHNILISVNGAEAEGEAYVTAYNRLQNTQGDWDELIQGLRYLDRYRKSGGRWQFTQRTVVCDWAQHQPAFWDGEHSLLKGKRFGAVGDRDASYECLSLTLFNRHDDD